MTARRTRGWPLRRQLVLVLIAVLLVFTSAVALASTLALRGQLIGRLDAQLTHAAQRLVQPPPATGPFRPGAGEPEAARPSDPPAGTRPDGGERAFGPWIGQDAGTVVLVSADGEVRRAGYLTQRNAFTELTDEQVADLRAVPQDGRQHDVRVTGLGDYRATAVVTSAGDQAVIALPTSQVTDTVRRYVLVEAVIGVVGLALTVAGGTWLVRRSLRPLESVASAAGRVSEMELASGVVAPIPRVADADTDERTEAGLVGAALNRMIDNVEASLAARHASETHVRQFVADASHELRTPLASIRGYAELVRHSPDVVPPSTAQALRRIESEAARMGALVDDLLLLARLDAGRPLDRAPVDLALLAVDAVADAHAAGPDHRWELDLPGLDDTDTDIDPTGDLADDLVVLGDEARLRQVLTNLLGNARVHTPAGTRVVVGVRADGAGDVVVSVRDDGPGIPAPLRPTLFQRFTRGDAARTRAAGSTGLGLAIVQSIVAAHGGSIDVVSRTADDAVPGVRRGTTVEVSLPTGSATPAERAPGTSDGTVRGRPGTSPARPGSSSGHPPLSVRDPAPDGR
ncbi:sensor histidine kinase [Xylanimonas protaetiae]|uniref:histidine kinase n=1 Tax=Xylanimonas protaetiae TaxID=2509457 RepID=A0A4P6F5U0_9MICO|nr:HAMP domain-containing sensor histidine kinase [Xylanimonas protaetiae]QAY70755.1 HAMP domain-containing histidine kinase [Xylanimonas protaetiae]